MSGPTSAKISSFFHNYDSSLSLEERMSSLDKAIRNMGLEEAYKRLYILNHFGFPNPHIEADLALLKDRLQRLIPTDQKGGAKARTRSHSDSHSNSSSGSKLADISDTKFTLINLE